MVLCFQTVCEERAWSQARSLEDAHRRKQVAALSLLTKGALATNLGKKPIMPVLLKRLCRFYPLRAAKQRRRPKIFS